MPLSAAEQKKMISAQAPIEDSYPLAPLQLGMLFHALNGDQPGVDIEQMLFTVHADLDIQAFKRAWQRVLDRHAILRTSFIWEGLDEPRQRVHRHADLDLHQEDWRTLSGSDQHDRLKAYLQTDRETGFDLSQDSLMRIAVFQIAERDFHLVWTFHHVILDGRSLIHVLNQVHAFYNSSIRGIALDLPPPRPFRDHIEMLEQIDLSEPERFWRNTLRGFTEPTPLPAAYPDSTAPSNQAHDEQEVRLSSALTSSLKSVAFENGVTLYTLVEAAWVLLLSRYSGEQDVVFGGVRACRSLPDAVESVGLFINTLPVRVTVRAEESLLSLLQELRAQHLELREYEHTPLQKIREWCDIASGRPLFETLIVFENHDLRSLIQSHWSDWEIRDFKLIEQTNYPISLSGWSGDELLLKIEYHRQRFDDATIGRMLGHLSTMLESVPSHLQAPVASLPMLTAAERQQIVVEWNETSSSPRQISVVQMFEEQTARTPAASAVICGDTQLTYQELNKRANQLAHYLVSVGVGPETLVGISVERSLEMVVGLLGILKAGGAYLPLDSGYPRERLAAMLKDAGVAVLLTQQRLLPKLPQVDAPVVCLDADWERIARHPEVNPRPGMRAENLAYVIYTSGSTGTPKGVPIEHRSLAGYVDFAGGEFGITPDDRVLQFASSSFDTSAEEIYPCLARGATLVLRTDAMLNSISSFLRHCVEWNITVLDLPTAFWHELAAALSAKELTLPDSIRLVIIGGERALPERVLAWRKCVPSSVRLLNTYGPTESTIVATISDLSKETRSSEGLWDVPVGRPIPNTSIYILDKQLQPAPVGVNGEVYIGGAGLARGYLNRPELTAERLIPDPFSYEPGARLYKTGDLARYSPDGNVQIAGRIDDQVKINGFRIELAEIEKTLCSSPDVHDAIVLAAEDIPGEKHLLAYIVPRQSADLVSQGELRNQLRGFLKRKLPNYMVPSAFVVLDELPISNNGKVDRSRLPAPDSNITPNDAYERPRDPLERQLVEIWEELLNVSPIGIRDSFFDLGGHSLLSVRMMGRIEQITGQKLPLATLFEQATIEHLAAGLLEQEKAGPRSPIVKVKEGGSRRPFFFLHGDFNGGGFYCLNLARGLADDQPFYAVQPHGLDGGPMPLTIEAMAESHLQALRAVQSKGPYLLGGYCNGAVVAFEIARLLQSQGEQIDLLVLLCASVSEALRFKLLQNIVNHLSGVEDLGPEERLDRFLAYRERLTRINEIKDYYRERMAGFARLGARERVAFVKQKSRTAVSNLARTLASIRGNGDSRASSPHIQVKPQISANRRQRVTTAYTKAIRAYVPRSYYGRVTVIWPSELALEDPDDPTAGWSRVAAAVDVHSVPGGHITCVTSHVHQLARTLRVCLDELQRGASNGSALTHSR